MARGPGLSMKMTADTVGISRGINRTERLLGQLTKSTQQATNAMRGLVAIEVGKIVAGGFRAASSAVSSYISDIRTTVDETAKLAARTGIAVEALQGFQVAAGLSGVQNLEGAVQRLTISIGDAAQGNKTAVDAFERLNLSFEQLSRLRPEDQFRAVAEQISALPTAAERAAAAADLFGRTGVELLPLFESNLADIEERAQRLGLILAGPQTKAIEDMNDALSLVDQTFRGIIAQVTANLAPIVTQLSNEFLAFVESFKEAGGGGTGIAEVLTDGLLRFANFLARIFDQVLIGLGQFGDNFENNMATLTAAGQIFTAVVNSLRVVFLSFQNVGLAIRRIVAQIPGVGTEDVGDIMALQAQTREQIDAALAGIGGAGAPAEAELPEGPGRIEQAVLDLIEQREQRLANALQGAEQQADQVNPLIASFVGRAVDIARQASGGVKTVITDLADNVKKGAENMRQTNEQLGRLYEQLGEAEAEQLQRSFENRQRALEVSDIRSGGIASVIALATGREDPALDEARKQSRRLEEIKAEIRNLGGTVEIAGAA